MKEIFEFYVALMLVCITAYISYKIGIRSNHIDE
jgi:hypothetical protein